MSLSLLTRGARLLASGAGLLGVAPRVPALAWAHTPSCAAALHCSPPRCDLMEFFDDKDNWGADRVRVGRQWKKDELRLKSNSDLHKLW